MNKFSFFKFKKGYFLLLLLLAVISCNAYQSDGETVITNTTVNGSATDNFMILPQENPYMLRTTFRANDLDLETPRAAMLIGRRRKWYRFFRTTMYLSELTAMT